MALISACERFNVLMAGLAIETTRGFTLAASSVSLSLSDVSLRLRSRFNSSEPYGDGARIGE